MPLTLNLQGSLISLATPKVMAIVNVTPDSFYVGSRTSDAESLRSRVRQVVAEGADIIDIGGYSTRRGADDISAEEEYSRLARGLEVVRQEAPETPLSIDTFRASVADKCIDAFGPAIINDISGGQADPAIWDVAAERRVPYILMHMRGTPQTMQSLASYSDITAEVVEYLAFKAAELHRKGVADVILDPGFGFAKTVEDNYRLLGEMEAVARLGMPLLAGLSRKSMIYKVLGNSPQEALPGTIALNTVALLKGANILRVHDVAPAADQVKIIQKLKENV